MPLVISKTRLWPKIGYAPNRAQRAIHGATTRMLVVPAGRRTGKSTAGGVELVPEAYRAYLMRRELEEHDERHEYWITGPQYTDGEKEFRRFYNACRRLKMPFDKPGTYYDKRGGDMKVSLWGGRFLVTVQSAKYPEHLVGEGLSGVVMAEAAKMKERIWQQFIRPTLADYHGWAKFTSTPEGRNWFYDLYMLGQDPKEVHWSSMRFPSWANELLFPGGKEDPEITAMTKDLSPEMAKQEIEAEFSEYVGQVFKTWDEEWHVRSVPYRPEWPLYLATDYGWTNPNVCLFIQIDPFDRIYIIGEYYQTHRSPEEFAADLLDGAQSTKHPGWCRVARELYPDPEDPGASHTLAEALHVRVMGNTGGELKDRLELIRKWLKDENDHLGYDHVDRRPKIVVDFECKNFIREMEAYRYPKSKAESDTTESEKPLNKDNHCPEALGRIFAGKYGLAGIRGAARVHKVKYRR